MTHRFDNNKIYRAALYCRLSKDDDDRTGDSSSIQTQKSLLEDYCRGHGFLIHGFYVDDGYSGLNYDRPDFQRMLTDIDNGIVNMVITKDDCVIIEPTQKDLENQGFVAGSICF